MVEFFRWGWDGGHGGMRYGSPQEPYRPSASDPATADSIFKAPLSPAAVPLPLVSLPFSTNPDPEKEKNGFCH